MSTTDPTLLGVVLAGGRSVRMGTDKALLKTPAGRTFLHVAIARARQVCTDVLVAGRTDVADSAGAEQIPDERPGLGPLAGIAAALEWALARNAARAAAGRSGAAETAAYEALLVQPCDMPNLGVAALHELRDAWSAGPGSAVVATFDGVRPEPLLAIYPLTLRTAVADCLERGARSVQGLFMQSPHRLVRLTLRAPGEDRNMNTPTDLDESAPPAA